MFQQGCLPMHRLRRPHSQYAIPRARPSREEEAKKLRLWPLPPCRPLVAGACGEPGGDRVPAAGPHRGHGAPAQRVPAQRLCHVSIGLPRTCRSCWPCPRAPLPRSTCRELPRLAPASKHTPPPPCTTNPSACLRPQVCHIAARPGGARYADLNGMAVRQLYQRGLVWLEVPVRPEDHLSIPPLEVGTAQLWYLSVPPLGRGASQAGMQVVRCGVVCCTRLAVNRAPRCFRLPAPPPPVLPLSLPRHTCRALCPTRPPPQPRRQTRWRRCCTR